MLALPLTTPRHPVFLRTPRVPRRKRPLRGGSAHGIKHRYYDPNTGSYLQLDPILHGSYWVELYQRLQERRSQLHAGVGDQKAIIGEIVSLASAVRRPDHLSSSGFNPYAYVGLNPLGASDPTGAALENQLQCYSDCIMMTMFGSSEQLGGTAAAAAAGGSAACPACWEGVGSAAFDTGGPGALELVGSASRVAGGTGVGLVCLALTAEAACAVQCALTPDYQ